MFKNYTSNPHNEQTYPQSSDFSHYSALKESKKQVGKQGNLPTYLFFTLF